MTKNLYVYTDKYQKKLMRGMMNKMNRITYQRLQLELASYGYVDMKESVKKYPTESFVGDNNETC